MVGPPVSLPSEQGQDVAASPRADPSEGQVQQRSENRLRSDGSWQQACGRDGLLSKIRLHLWRLGRDYSLVLLVYVLWKILLVYTMHVANAGLDGSQNEWNRHFLKDNHFWGAPFANWDGQHYLMLSQKGYAASPPESAAFYPLFPLVTRLLRFITSDLFLAAFLVSTGFGLCVVLQFYKALKQSTSSAKGGLLGIILFLSYPSAFYLTALYPESLVLFLIVGFFYFYAMRRSKVSILFALLLPWSKGQGILFGAFLVLDLLVSLARRKKREVVLAALNVLAIAVGLVSLLGFYKFATGNALAHFHAQEHFVFHLSVGNLLSPSHFLKYFFSPSNELFDYNNSLLDKFFIGFVFVCFIPVAFGKRYRVTLLFLLLALTTAMMGEGGSFIRHSLLLWPFVILSLLRKKRLSGVAICSLAGLLLMVQLYFASRFAANLWVG
jgi:hypothetical protein